MSSSRCSFVSGGRSLGCLRQRDSGRRRSEPSPVHGASTSTRSNPASGSSLSLPASRPSIASTLAGMPRTALTTMFARCSATSTAVRKAPRWAAIAASRPALPPGPAHRSSHCSSRPSSGAFDERERDQLTAFVLDVGPPVADLGQLPGRAGGKVDRVGRKRTRVATDPLGQLGSVDLARAGRTGAPRGVRCRPPAHGRSRPDRRRSRLGTPALSTPDGCGPSRDGRPGPAPPSARPRPASRRGPSRAMRRSTALAKPVAPGATDRTRSTVEATAACDGTRVCRS